MASEPGIGQLAGSIGTLHTDVPHDVTHFQGQDRLSVATRRILSYEKQRLSDAWAYVFRHRVLGELGRILLQELDDGRCHISCEVVGDPADPMTTQRTAIFKPLGLELARQMEAAMCSGPRT